MKKPMPPSPITLIRRTSARSRPINQSSALATTRYLPSNTIHRVPSYSYQPLHHHHHHHHHHQPSSSHPSSSSRLLSSSSSSPPQSTQSWPSTAKFDEPIIDPHDPQLVESILPNGPADIYQDRVRQGFLRFDQFQVSIVNQLQSLFSSLAHYQPQPTSNQPPSSTNPSNWLRSLFAQSNHPSNLNHHSLPPIPSNLPNGIYLYGSVGTGKSMLMDLFYDSLINLPNQSSLPSKRIHFHQFMVDVHKRNHNLQSQSADQPHLAQSDVLITIAEEISRECKVLCFDEFQVTDIVDAMILKRLLEGLLAHGVVIVMTSNRHPDELYKNGIQRESFLPCIEMIKKTHKVTDLNSGTDYRKLIELSTTTTDGTAGVFMTPINEINRVEFKKKFEVLTDDEPLIENRKLQIWGSRELQIPLSTSKVAWFSFDSLCSHPLSAADYLQIVNRFKFIFLDQVTSLSISQRDIARRFILFIDAAYESKTKLYTLSEVPIAEIFSGSPKDGSPSKSQTSITTEMRSAMDDLGLDLKTIEASSIFTGEEEMFAWARAVSRLNEMGSNRWNNFKDLNNNTTASSSSNQGHYYSLGRHSKANLSNVIGSVTSLSTSELVQDVADRVGSDGSELLNHQ